MKKKWVPRVMAVGVFVGFIVLGQACATTPTPTKSVELSANYRVFLQQPIGNERIIDTISVRGNTSFVCRDGQHSITPAQRLGAPYQVRIEQPQQEQSRFMAILAPTPQQAATRRSDRHDHEPILDQLLNEARRHYPGEVVSIKNARTGRHIPTNHRWEEFHERNPNTGATVLRTRSVWDCFPDYFADVITTEPMPQPVTHSENFTMPGMTRNDIYRRAQNWLEDNTQNRRITITSADFDRGRIAGRVTSAARTGQTYLVTSDYTIDVYDARVEMRFTNTILRRTDASLRNTGNPEPIFLQSIADATRAELVDFATSLRSSIVSR